MDKNLITIAVSHHIYLTRDQRYNLVNGEIVEVIGVSVPVWHYRGRTSEPANEIFCKYILTNWSDAEEGLRQNADGYEINIPQPPKEGSEPFNITDEEWRSLSGSDRELYEASIREVFDARLLLDLKEGGCASLSFNQFNKIIMKTVVANGIHLVRIEDIKTLEESIF